jgi:1-acyl-sn-glycerol-3-phosphate acyltransferase
MQFLAVWPVGLVAKRKHRLLVSCIQYLHFGACCFALTLSGFKVYVQDVELAREILTSSDTGSMWLYNHTARGDFFVGMIPFFSGWLQGCMGCGWRDRFSVVTERVSVCLPGFGWWIWFSESIFLHRRLDKDAVMLRATVVDWLATGLRRIIYFSPEGKLADPGTEDGEEYIKQCTEYCAAMGRPPLNYVLTPRHSGLYHTMKHYPRGTRHLCSVHALTQNGIMLNQRLDSAQRIVPDIIRVFSGCSAHVSFFECPRLWDEDNAGKEADSINIKECKARLLALYGDEYDTRLAYFEEHGCFPGAETPVAIGPPILKQFIAFIVQQLTVGFALAMGFSTLGLWRAAYFNVIGTFGLLLVVTSLELKEVSNSPGTAK